MMSDALAPFSGLGFEEGHVPNFLASTVLETRVAFWFLASSI